MLRSDGGEEDEEEGVVAPEVGAESAATGSMTRKVAALVIAAPATVVDVIAVVESRDGLCSAEEDEGDEVLLLSPPLPPLLAVERTSPWSARCS